MRVVALLVGASVVVSGLGVPEPKCDHGHAKFSASKTSRAPCVTSRSRMDASGFNSLKSKNQQSTFATLNAQEKEVTKPGTIDMETSPTKALKTIMDLARAYNGAIPDTDVRGPYNSWGKFFKLPIGLAPLDVAFIARNLNGFPYEWRLYTAWFQSSRKRWKAIQGESELHSIKYSFGDLEEVDGCENQITIKLPTDQLLLMGQQLGWAGDELVKRARQQGHTSSGLGGGPFDPTKAKKRTPALNGPADEDDIEAEVESRTGHLGELGPGTGTGTDIAPPDAAASAPFR